MEYYLEHRTADKKETPFCVQMDIQAKTAEDDQIHMTYDEEYLSELLYFYSELKELPQWTGAGPVIPYIESAEMLEKFDLANATISFVISGSSVAEVAQKKNASLTCHVEIPVNPKIPDTLPNGKLMWFYKEVPWKNIADNSNKVTFTVQYDSLSAILGEDSPRAEKVKFCYESAGGSHVNDLELSSDILDNSTVVINPYSKDILEACLNELETASDTAAPVLRKYEITGLDSDKPDAIPLKVLPKEADKYGSIQGDNITNMPQGW